MNFVPTFIFENIKNRYKEKIIIQFHFIGFKNINILFLIKFIDMIDMSYQSSA